MSEQTKQMITSPIDASVSQRCRYQGRPCDQPRDTKLNGDLHRFCRAHRLRHNEYQRGSQRRRLERQRAMDMLATEAIADPSPTNDDEPGDDFAAWMRSMFEATHGHVSPTVDGGYRVFTQDTDIEYCLVEFDNIVNRLETDHE